MKGENETEFVIMITKLPRIFLFFLCSYGNDENIHIRTQRETSNMRAYLRTAAAVSLFHVFYPPLVFNFIRYSVMIILGWR